MHKAYKENEKKKQKIYISGFKSTFHFHLLLSLFFLLIVEIFADTVEGNMTILSSGGNGRQGQNGAVGTAGANSLHKV